jgi:hypothetical protein
MKSLNQENDAAFLSTVEKQITNEKSWFRKKNEKIYL